MAATGRTLRGRASRPFILARRRDVRLALLEWLRIPDSDSVYGIGDDWSFDYPVEIVKVAWNMWRNSDYAHMPSYEDVASQDPAWVSDLMLMDQLFRWKNPKENAPQPEGASRFGDIHVPD